MTMDGLSKGDGGSRDEKGIKYVLKTFSEKTSLHGLKYVFNANSVAQRLFWTVFLVACTTGVVYQIVDRVVYYKSLPVNVDVSIKYNQSMVFPAVTICNQNTFKASSAAKYGWYSYIKAFFSKQGLNSSLTFLKAFNVSDISMSDIYQTFAHRKEDFILSCRWNRRSCKLDDFNTRLTDHGICYTFNGQTNGLLISETGVDAGLQVTLNVELYEYMTGPHDAVGVKMLLHSPNEFPAVHSQGHAIPTGSHAFAAVKYSHIENLPAPYGKCNHKVSEDISYTLEGCYLDCLRARMAYQCGCRESYMPNGTDDVPVCTVAQYIECSQILLGNGSRFTRDGCSCPVPCRQSLFNPEISYGSLSNALVHKLLTDLKTNTLKENALTAVSVTARMDKSHHNVFSNLAVRLSGAYTEMLYIIKSILLRLDLNKNITNTFQEEMTKSFQKKKDLYRFQKHCVQRNFIRACEAMEERTLQYVGENVLEFSLLLKRRILRLYQRANKSNSVKMQLYKAIEEVVDTKIALVDLASQNLTTLMNAYSKGKIIFNYKMKGFKRKHNSFIVPKVLFQQALHRKNIIRRGNKFCSGQLKQINASLRKVKKITDNIIRKQMLDKTELDSVLAKYKKKCVDFAYGKSLLVKGLDFPLKVLKKRAKQFEKRFDIFRRKIDQIIHHQLSFINSLNEIFWEIMPQIDNLLSLVTSYLRNSSDNLLDFAKRFPSGKIKSATQVMRDLLEDIKYRDQSVKYVWKSIRRPITELWKAIIMDKDMWDYYQHTNNEKFMQQFDDVLHKIDTNISSMTSSTIIGVIHSYGDILIQSIQELIDHIEHFVASVKIDNTFVRQNFLQLDIFFPKLSYQQVSQQKVYDAFALICDIGCAMGLFIGASTLTVVEIIDFCMTQILMSRQQEESSSEGGRNSVDRGYTGDNHVDTDEDTAEDNRAVDENKKTNHEHYSLSSINDEDNAVAEIHHAP